MQKSIIEACRNKLSTLLINTMTLIKLVFSFLIVYGFANTGTDKYKTNNKLNAYGVGRIKEYYDVPEGTVMEPDHVMICFHCNDTIKEEQPATASEKDGHIIYLHTSCFKDYAKNY